MTDDFGDFGEPGGARRDPAPVAHQAALLVLQVALEALMARWLATLDPNKVAALLRDLEGATAQMAASSRVDPLARDLLQLEVDKATAGFYERLARRAEELRIGHRGGRV